MKCELITAISNCSLNYILPKSPPLVKQAPSVSMPLIALAFLSPPPLYPPRKCVQMLIAFQVILDNCPDTRQVNKHFQGSALSSCFYSLPCTLRIGNTYTVVEFGSAAYFYLVIFIRRN